MTYHYYSDSKKPPAAISALGRVIRSMGPEERLMSKEIFDRAFAPHEDYQACKAMLCVAQARGYVEKAGVTRRVGDEGAAPLLFKLTDKGAAIQRAIEKR